MVLISTSSFGNSFNAEITSTGSDMIHATIFHLISVNSGPLSLSRYKSANEGTVTAI